MVSIYAGAMQIASGEETRTLTARMADSVFMSKFKPATKDEEAKLQGFGDALDLLGGLAGGAGKISQQLGKAVQVYKLTAGACDKLSKVGRAVKSYQGRNHGDTHTIVRIETAGTPTQLFGGKYHGDTHCFNHRSTVVVWCWPVKTCRSAAGWRCG